jgi:hypothetical protein
MEFQGGDNPAAEEQFRLVVKLAPGNAQAWISLAATLATESRIAEARDAVAHSSETGAEQCGGDCIEQQAGAGAPLTYELLRPGECLAGMNEK